MGTFPSYQLFLQLQSSELFQGKHHMCEYQGNFQVVIRSQQPSGLFHRKVLYGVRFERLWRVTAPSSRRRLLVKGPRRLIQYWWPPTPLALYLAVLKSSLHRHGDLPRHRDKACLRKRVTTTNKGVFHTRVVNATRRRLGITITGSLNPRIIKVPVLWLPRALRHRRSPSVPKTSGEGKANGIQTIFHTTSTTRVIGLVRSRVCQSFTTTIQLTIDVPNRFSRRR